MKKFTVLKSETIIDELYCNIEKQKVQFSNGQTGNWFIKHSPDAVVVIPQKETGEILLQKAYKHGGGEVITEFCAGMIDEGETALDAAKRELTEETGFVAQEFLFLGKTLANPTGSPMYYHFFLAKNITDTGKTQKDPSEQIETFFVDNLTEAKYLLTSSEERTSAATIAALTYCV